MPAPSFWWRDGGPLWRDGAPLDCPDCPCICDVSGLPYTAAQYSLSSANVAAPVSCTAAGPCVQVGPGVALPFADPVDPTAVWKTYTLDLTSLTPGPLGGAVFQAPASEFPTGYANAYGGVFFNVNVYCTYSTCVKFPGIGFSDGYYVYASMMWSGNCADSWNGTRYTRFFSFIARWQGHVASLAELAGPVTITPGDCANNAFCAIGDLTISFE